MGKGYNNYMCKKFFHPASRDNLKRVWMAEQRTEAERKKQEELRQQYEKEQELYNNKALMSKDSKEKIELNFMYEPPPGARRDEKDKNEDAEDGEPHYKFEWQRKWGTAPRESYCKGDDSIKDQPFGIQVRNVRCVKCHKYGHINTDKECTLYGKAMDSDAPVEAVNQQKLLEEMQQDGMKMRWSAWDLLDDPRIKKYSVITEDTKSKKAKNPEEIIKGLTKEEKKQLLKKLMNKERADKKRKKEKKKRYRSDSSESSSSSSEESESKRKRRKKSSKDDMRRKRSSTPSDNEDRRKKMGKKSYSKDEEDRKHRLSKKRKEEERRHHK